MSGFNAAVPLKTGYPTHTYAAQPKHLNDISRRLDNFTGGHYSGNNLSALLYAHRLDDVEHVKIDVWSPPGHTKPPFAEAKRQTYKPAKKGDEFGPAWTNHWFKLTLRIPASWSEYERVQFEFDMSGEAMVFTTTGEPIHGLTGGSGEDRRVEFIIPPAERRAGVVHYYIEASCNDMFGQREMERSYRLNSADLVVPNQEAWRLMWDFDALHQIYDILPHDCSLAMRAQWAANQIMNVFQEGKLESIGPCRNVAETILGSGWEKEIAAESAEAGKQKGTLWSVGHCHIDTAWLWPFSVTQQKSARSWSTQVDLMDRYPEHRFSATQAQQFKWVEQLYPTLFARIKEKVVEGAFQPLGATWIEMDTNMPSGRIPSCFRILVGGFVDFPRLLPASKIDAQTTVGYSSQLPQLCRLAGAQYFFTQKLSWNAVNNFPHSTFNWVGLDGSQVLTHMTPVNNYNSQCNIKDIRNGMTGHKNLDVTSQALLLFGNGDGGGGPTPPMLEKLRRARAIGKQPDAGGQLPLVKMGGSFEEFFESVRQETINGGKLPNWRGELYFEFHRGTYTSHGSIKKGNRKSEILMREAEYAATMASILDAEYEYPKARFDAAWEDLLLCQFHDVLPGSAIAMVYEDAETKYAAIQKSITQVLNEAYSVLYQNSHPLSAGGLASNTGTIFAVNNIPHYPRLEVVTVPVAAHHQIKSSSAQISKDGKTGYVLVGAEEKRDLLIAQPRVLTMPSVSVTQQGADIYVMANSNVRMTVDQGRIVSLVDVALEKELIPEGMSGGMVIMEDHPNTYDAWETDSFSLEKQTHLKFGSVTILEQGPLRATLGASLNIGQSSMEVEISLDAIAASVKADARSMVRFNAVVDWREKHKFLKFELPLDIHSDNATYESQFGYVSRPTHRNTSWDAAKFEVCAHKFADLSEYGYGVAILNDCKYGYATEGNVMRLSLLRAPTEPDPDCDMGTHRFTWAIYPHAGTYTESDVAQVAYAFNAPMSLRYSEEFFATALATTSPFKVSGAPNVVLETIKRGEDDMFEMDGKRTIILRLFEQLGGHAKATLNISGLTIKKAEIVNILEDPIEDLDVLSSSSEQDVNKSKDVQVSLDFRGFEVKTVRLTLGKKEQRASSDSWVVM
ncbi:MAG: Glycoside hydrolase, 38 vacuolar alpha mannosidase [Tremellales sp. Tagirdzhanova-0007]|nr:MAG: Glycoside hydrolase, 38 vacuolar alpha mannosidase [Tremellales sp. Tagirdzhanova-0007]